MTLQMRDFHNWSYLSVMGSMEVVMTLQMRDFHNKIIKMKKNKILKLL